MIINLTQHLVTPEQFEAGVIDLEYNTRLTLKKLITFDTLPSQHDLSERAKLVATLAHNTGAKKAMIGGAPFFMSHLEKALKEQGIIPYYAFSERVCSEKFINGKIIKVNEFKHLGFIIA